MTNHSTEIESLNTPASGMRGWMAIAASGVLAGFMMCALPAHAEDTQDSEHRTVGTFVDDASITARVKSGLVANDGLSALAIEVETHEGVVQLSGFVNTEDQIEVAEEIAERQKGVRDVENDLILKEDAE